MSRASIEDRKEGAEEISEITEHPRLAPPVAGAIVLILFAISIAPWDGYFSSIARNMAPTGDWRRLVMLSEVFAYGGSVAAILICIWWTDLARRKQVLQVGLLTLTSGLGSNLLKATLPRVRPNAMDRIQIGQSANGWLNYDLGSYWDSMIRSFPSGHSATAVAFAIGLAYLYPRGRYFFFGFAAIACCQRLISGAHYPSDILIGASVGCMAATAYVIVLQLRRNTPQG